MKYIKNIKKRKKYKCFTHPINSIKKLNTYTYNPKLIQLNCDTTQFKEMTVMYWQMSDVLLLEIPVHSKRNVLNGLSDCLRTIYAFMNCLGFQKFSEAILRQL